MEAIDFPISYFTWRTDWEKIPSRTTSSKPHFTLNNARIPLDNILGDAEIAETVDDREDGVVHGGPMPAAHESCEPWVSAQTQLVAPKLSSSIK